MLNNNLAENNDLSHHFFVVHDHPRKVESSSLPFKILTLSEKHCARQPTPAAEAARRNTTPTTKPP
jgi:hypothetical protein